MMSLKLKAVLSSLRKWNIKVMNKKEIQELTSEGIEIRHYFDDKLTAEQFEKLNRLIEIELLLEAESNK